MKTRIKSSVVCAAAIIALLAFGCEKKSEEEKQLGDIVKEGKEKAKEASDAVQEGAKEIEAKKDVTGKELSEGEAADMSAGELRSKVMELKDKILAKQADRSELSEQLKKIPVTEMLGEKAKALKSDIEKLNQVIKELTDQYKLFYDLLKAKNGDLSGLEL